MLSYSPAYALLERQSFLAMRALRSLLPNLREKLKRLFIVFVRGPSIGIAYTCSKSQTLALSFQSSPAWICALLSSSVISSGHGISRLISFQSLKHCCVSGLPCFPCITYMKHTPYYVNETLPEGNDIFIPCVVSFLYKSVGRL